MRSGLYVSWPVIAGCSNESGTEGDLLPAWFLTLGCNPGSIESPSRPHNSSAGLQRAKKALYSINISSAIAR